MTETITDEATPFAMTVADLAGRLARGETLHLVDVREPWETELCRIDGSLNIPLGQLPGRAGDVPDDAPVVVICHHGARSAQATQFLRARGVRAINLTGGIDAWARQQDPSMAVY